MPKNLVIVESPAKAKTIEGFLGKDFTVKSSYGHVRDLVKENNGVNIEKGFQPSYEVSPEKKDVVKELKKLADNSEMVWLASDEDREGEAISWHLREVLSLPKEKTKRIVFHEITKPAILRAIENPRDIDEHLVDAQQARRVLDRLVGFELSPVLWKKVKPSLSAGRVQSVAVRLIVEREREIKEFSSETFFKISAVFNVTGTDGRNYKMKAELPDRFPTEADAQAVLEKLKSAQFTILSTEKKPLTKNPAPPFTTSTLQQEASRKLRFPVGKTMSVAQKLYESGLITYMRTDSTNLSELALGTSKKEIISAFGEQYSKTRQYKTKSASAQEAHEAIRPTYFENHTVKGSADEVALYQLIWRRAIASQMASAELEKTIIKIAASGVQNPFVAEGEVIRFDGFLKVYLESNDDDDSDENGENQSLLPPVKEGDNLFLNIATAKQGYTRPPSRYNEASLVKKLEELGIGRPSTYAPTISTVQQRGYVERSELDGSKRPVVTLTLENNQISKTQKEETTGADKGKLIPTDIGVLVTDFLTKNFPKVMDYKFTAKVEEEFDLIAEGKLRYNGMLEAFYKPFHDNINETLETSEKVTGERILGTHPDGRQVSVRMSRFGPVAQLTDLSDPEAKPQYANLPKGESLETISLETVMPLFSLPRELGEYDGKPLVVNIGRYGPYVKFGTEFISLGKDNDPYSVTYDEAVAIITDKNKLPKEIGTFEGEVLTVGKGRFGPYVKFKSDFVSLKKGMEPLELTEAEAIQLILEKREKTANATIATFEEDIQVLNGRFGPYIKQGKENYKIPKGVEAATLSFDEVKAIIEASGGGKKAEKKPVAKKATSAKKPAAKKSTSKTTKK